MKIYSFFFLAVCVCVCVSLWCLFRVYACVYLRVCCCCVVVRVCVCVREIGDEEMRRYIIDWVRVFVVIYDDGDAANNFYIQHHTLITKYIVVSTRDIHESARGKYLEFSEQNFSFVLKSIYSIFIILNLDIKFQIFRTSFS